jgi:uncharacterized membrane protein YcaP (DUF421 family)
MDASTFQLTVPLWEILVRGSVVYWFLFVVFRCILRRSMGSVGVSDFIFVVIIADASQNAMSGDAKSIGDGLVLISALVFWNILIDWLSFKTAWVRKFVEAPPLVLVKNGKLQRREMRKEFVTQDEIMAKLRQEGINSIAEVKQMQIEMDGEISVIRYEDK